MLAYSVERRTGEIGVRMALGAGRGRVIAMVLAGAFWQVSIGLGFGIPAAIGAGKLMTVQLFGVQPWDPIMLTIATLSLGLGALVASMIPAWRAARVEPMAALRAESRSRKTGLSILTLGRRTSILTTAERLALWSKSDKLAARASDF